jgi:hypothetical protein
VCGIVQPPDIFPSILDFMGIPVPDDIDGGSFWPLVTGETTQGRTLAFSNRYPAMAGAGRGAAFDGWVGSDRIVEPATVTDDEWAMIFAPQGLPSALYHLREDPAQQHNVIDAHPEVAARMQDAWITFLQNHGAPEARIRPFQEGQTGTPMQPNAKFYAFHDDAGQWVAFPTAHEAQAAAYDEAAPGPQREIREVTFSELHADNPKSLIHWFDQYYWAEDLTE